jgi:OPT oligopeptide transporter protein
MFSYVCWMAPNNVVVNQLFGVRSGLGFGILTFDWSQISFIGSPLMVPWWAQVHVIVGFILFYWASGLPSSMVLMLTLKSDTLDCCPIALL